MYKITLRKRAAKEYIEAIAWYKERSLLAAENFVKAVNDVFTKLEFQPEAYRNTYKYFYEIKIKKYPFSMVYFIDEGNNCIVIATLFHTKRDPKKKFGR